MSTNLVVGTAPGVRHAVERAYPTGRNRTVCGRVMRGELAQRDSFDDYPVTCPICVRVERNLRYEANKSKYVTLTFVVRAPEIGDAADVEFDQAQALVAATDEVQFYAVRAGVTQEALDMGADVWEDE